MDSNCIKKGLHLHGQQLQPMTADEPDRPDGMTETWWVRDDSKCGKQVGRSLVLMTRVPCMQFDQMQIRVAQWGSWERKGRKREHEEWDKGKKKG